MKKIIFSTIAILLATQSISHAQEQKDNFLFLGGTLSHFDVTGRSSSNNDVTIGLETVYMHKVVGNLAFGGGLNYNFALSRSAGSVGSQKTHFHDYNASLLIGGIFDHSNGGRTTILAGPIFGGTTFVQKFDDSKYKPNFKSAHYTKIGQTTKFLDFITTEEINLAVTESERRKFLERLYNSCGKVLDRIDRKRDN